MKKIILSGEIGNGCHTANKWRDYLYIESNSNVEIEINSNGGEVFEGFSIYNLIKNYEYDTTVIIDGIVAGIASVIAMAGKKIYMTPKSNIIIKNPCVYSLDKSTYSSDILRQIKSMIIDAYMTRGLSIQREDISRMMDNETCFNASSALKYGFVDGIIMYRLQ